MHVSRVRAMLRKLFPAGFTNSPFNSFKIVLVAEGYLANETARFIGDCVDLIEALFDTAPFGLTHMSPGWLSIYAGFTASGQSGPAINVPATPTRTAFESSLTTVTGLLSLNQSKVNAWVTGETLLADSVELPLDQFFTIGAPSTGLGGALLVVLLPNVAAQPAGGEAESILGPNDVHYLAVTKNGFYQQVVARGIAAQVGLGDEFELPGVAYLEPGAAGLAIPYNLEVFEGVPPSPIDSRSKWYALTGVSERTSLTGVHMKADPTTPDVTIDVAPARQSRIEFWEGGGGFRTKVWRSAHDCLMRRRFGDATLPVRKAKVSFCPACGYHLRGVIG
jgi:hypothetical protein